MATNTCFLEELVQEILVKMPIKSILRCKVLSKHYYSLIRSQCFTLRHLQLAKLHKNKLFDGSFLSPVLGSVHLFEPGGHAKVLERIPCIFAEGSSNVDDHYYQKIESICGPLDGLYCVLEIRKISSRRCITVWNPATREHFILPHPKHNDIFDYKSSPKRSIDKLGIHTFGFGHDSNKNNYKVVIIYAHIISDEFDKKLYFYVFDLGERNYKECRIVYPRLIESKAGVFIQGACHWVSPPRLQGNTASSLYVGYAILAFDMSRETHSVFPLPNGVVDGISWSFNSIVTLDGCLALINTLGFLDILGGCSCFNVWVMEEYGVTESWKRLYRVSLPPQSFGRFLGIIGDRFYVAEEEGWMVSYDLRSKYYERSNILSSNIHHIVPYEESLVRIVAT